MMIFRYSTFRSFLLIFLLISCSNGATKVQSPKEIELRKFISRLKVLKLPLNILTSTDMDNEYEKLPNIYSMPDDVLFEDSGFLKSNHLGGAKCYGLLPDTMDCFHVIWFAPADNYQPVLTTYLKTGTKISRDQLCIGECGGNEPCFDCNEAVVIQIDYTIYSADTMIVKNCDSLNNPLSGKPSISVKYKTGKIPHSGKPVFSEEKEKKIK